MRKHAIAAVFCSAAPLLLTPVSVAQTSGTGTVTITVDPAVRRPISPYIYGVNHAGNIEGLPDGVTLNRGGGNRATAYNWETNASNAGSDWQYQNDDLVSTSREPAAVAGGIAGDQKVGMASIVTVQMQGLVAGDVNGPVSVANPPDRKRFKTVVFEKKTVSQAPFTATPPTSDDYVFMDEFVWALDRKFAGKGIFDAKPAVAPVFVSLDNEPELWNHTHLEIQGKTGITSDAYIAKTIALATALKKQFPDMTIFGPVHYGFMGLYNWSTELAATPSGNNWFTDKYLNAMRNASKTFGKPLVDVYDFHWYPEATDGAGTRVISLMGPKLSDDQVQAIVQSPRSLWDKTYREKSWIANDVIGGPVAILDRIQSRIDAEYPGMKLALTEYDNGGGLHIAGTLAQADNLGIFGARGLFAANLWLLTPKEPYSLAAFRAYRDFDGAKHHFGDTSVQAVSSNVANVAAYVSLDSTRAGRVVIVAINRSPASQATTITGQPLTGTAHLFRITAETAAKQKIVRPVPAGDQPASGTSLTVTLPPLSVTTIDVY